MQEDEMKVQIDYAAIVKDIADKAVCDMIAAFMPDDQTKKFWMATLAVHRKYGVDAVTSMKIMQEIAELIKPEIDPKKNTKEWNGDMCDV